MQDFSSSFSGKQIELILLQYEDVFPGSIIYEESDKTQILATYRIEKEGLIQLIQGRQLPFDSTFWATGLHKPVLYATLI